MIHLSGLTSGPYGVKNTIPRLKIIYFDFYVLTYAYVSYMAYEDEC